MEISSGELVTLAAVQDAIGDWLASAELREEDWQLRGPKGVARNFSLAFTGAPAVALRKQNKAFAALRKGGAWLEIFAEVPSKRQIKLYIDPDTNNKRKSLERVGKMLYDVVQEEVYTALDTNLVRNVGMVCVDWLPLVRVEAKAEN